MIRRGSPPVSDTVKRSPLVLVASGRAVTAVNPDSTLLPVTRSNGELLTGVFPRGGVIPGRAGVIRLDGWTVADMTVLGESPPGRTPVVTEWAQGPMQEQLAWDKVRTEVAAGHQAYVVCPLIEESEKIEARSAEEGRSFLNGRLGERIAGENITLWDDGLDSSGVPMAFDFEGMPKQRVTFIDRGVAQGAVGSA